MANFFGDMYDNVLAAVPMTMSSGAGRATTSSAAAAGTTG